MELLRWRNRSNYDDDELDSLGCFYGEGIGVGMDNTKLLFSHVLDLESLCIACG